MSDTSSEEYKRGFILGMAMNPLMVTTETAEPAPSPAAQGSDGVIVGLGACGISGLTILNTVILCRDASEGGL